MPPSSSVLSFPDARRAFERAIDAQKGVVVRFSTMKEAQVFALRANKFRSLDRKENAKIYDSPTHSLHGRSVFDTIQILVRKEPDGTAVVKLMKVAEIDIEDIE